MEGTLRIRVPGRDLLVAGLLLFYGGIIALPIFLGGWTTYLDNPAHVAEIEELAGGTTGGWSDLAYCGFPLFSLQSPLWYGLLGAWTRLGLPLPPAYAIILWLSFCLPALAVYHVARRRLDRPGAAVLAFILLIQRPALVGSGSAFGGMWTFFIASAGLVWLADRLARPPGDPDRRHVRIAFWTAFIGLTHPLVTIAAAWLFVVHFTLRLLRRDRPGRELLLDTAAVGLGTAACALYWLPPLIARDALHLFRWNLTPGQLGALLFLPADMESLLLQGKVASALLFYTDALPLILLPAAACAGIWIVSRRSIGRAIRRDDLPLYGFVFSLLVIFLLVAVVPRMETSVLGPISWRQTYTARLGFALGATPLLARFSLRPSRLLGVAGAILAAAAALWFGLPLRDQMPTESERREVEDLWSRLRDQRRPDWGRVYFEDTFLNGSLESRLAFSHLLALSSSRSGVPQLGAYYGAVPFETSRWTSSLVAAPGKVGPERMEYLRSGMRATDCTHLVLSEPSRFDAFASDPRWRQLYRSGRFALFAARGASSERATPLTEGVEVEARPVRPGEIELLVRADGAGGAVLVKEAYFPFWRLEGGGVLARQQAGLMQVDQLPAGSSRLRLVFRPPRGPWWITAVAWACIAAWALGGLRRREVRGTVPAPASVRSAG